MRYWVIAPFSSKEKEFAKVWAFDLQSGIISIGFTELPDVSGLSEDQLRQLIERRLRGQPKRRKDYFFRSLWNFYHSIKSGDAIIACQGRKKILALGRVRHSAYYEYNKNPDAQGRAGPYSNHLDVLWRPFEKSFDNSEFHRNAIYEISEEKFQGLTRGRLTGRLPSVRNGHRDATADIVDALESAKERGSGQGFSGSPQVRKALEKYAVSRAMEYFRRRGFKIKEEGKPYDLCCTRSQKQLFVEVKGTQGSWEKVILTRNEVSFARRKRNEMVLFVVHHISISGGPQRPHASGGTSHILRPWDIDAGKLDPPAYEYYLPH